MDPTLLARILRDPNTHYCARATQLLLNKCCSGGESLASLCPILTGLRFERQTSRSRDERVTAPPTSRLSKYLNYAILTAYRMLKKLPNNLL